MFKNYYKDLMHYLNLYKETCRGTTQTLNNVITYLKKVLNENSATDTTNILYLEKLKDKFDYQEKYIDIAIKYFEEK